MKKPVNVLIVEDSRISQEIMESAIARSKGRYTHFLSIQNASMAELSCMTGMVDLILMDIYTDRRENGIEAAKKIKKNYPKIKIIITTSLPEESFIRRAKEAGCESFWYKETSEEDLLEIMDRTMAGESLYPEDTPTLQIGNIQSIEFTPKEIEVLREKVSGRSNEEICVRLGIKVSTLEYHIRNILMKTGCKNTVQLVSIVMEQKFVLPDF